MYVLVWSTEIGSDNNTPRDAEGNHGNPKSLESTNENKFLIEFREESNVYMLLCTYMVKLAYSVFHLVTIPYVFATVPTGIKKRTIVITISANSACCWNNIWRWLQHPIEENLFNFSKYSAAEIATLKEDCGTLRSLWSCWTQISNYEHQIPNVNPEQHKRHCC